MKRLEKFGDYLLDISKYTLTGVVLSIMFDDFGGQRALLYIVGLVVSASFLVLGLFMCNKKENK